MKFVALFRNLNLGHKGSPSSAELLAAFGGPGSASNFQTNGTVVFESADLESTKELAKSQLAELGYHHSFVVLTLADLAEIFGQSPEVDSVENVYRVMVSFFDATKTPVLTTPVRSRDNLVEVRSISTNHAWSLCWKHKSSVGDVTGFLERQLQVPVTSRTSGTLERLVKKFGDS
ncbi:DUF1697 domain-containing protein [Neomicrococcus aestuarii]|uniref:DUF1697 domain-containing protein n=1 Tax=Neomicrococcus aestuarii TaxID=556325 RepID=A0A1L2ZNG0_9MICC|nr:DUF1697 domain-containing protein [Neomicrococcus aestuarii]APF40679.1 DUF1697 domain-containing protein [Neomicrococcus aestuarii]